MKDIPVLCIRGPTLAIAYERALVALWEHGSRQPTQYDQPEHPLSLDATMNLTIDDPLAEPMIHKAFPGGFSDLREYVMELEGIKDSWVKCMDDPKDTRWEYTYHGRLAHWGQWREKAGWKGIGDVDQIQALIKKLAKSPSSRQAQAITWMPTLDLDCYDPPCLQSLWYRIVEDTDGIWYLNCNVRFRSNDAWGANFMNMFGFTQFNLHVVAAGIAKLSGKTVRLGRMNWQADSFHIYGKDLAAAKSMLFDRIVSTTLEDRTYRFNDSEIQELYTVDEAIIRQKIEETNTQMTSHNEFNISEKKK